MPSAESSTHQPALFIGHGSPMNAIEDNAFSRSWRKLGEDLPRPRAILCISAHWETSATVVSTAAHPATIHDFGGFPKALFDVQYPAPGAPWLADRVAALLVDRKVWRDPQRGLDHGAWSVLRRLYPDAEVPVAQMSLDPSEPGAAHYQIGRALAPLRDEGVMILGTGNLIHNLRAIDWRGGQGGFEWAERIDAAMKQHLVSGKHEAMQDPLALDPQRMAIPTPEHYLPVLYVLGAALPGEEAQIFNDVLVMGSLSMTSVGFGM